MITGRHNITRDRNSRAAYDTPGVVEEERKGRREMCVAFLRSYVLHAWHYVMPAANIV